MLLSVHKCKEQFIDTYNAELQSDTIRSTDTVQIVKPTLRSEAKMGSTYIRVPRIKGGGAGGIERLCMQDTNCSASDIQTHGGANADSSDDSITVALPITQRVYEGEGYTAWVSGVMPQLDSITVYQRRETIKIKHPPKRWHIGPSVGVGLTPNGAEPYIGVSLTYSIFSF